MAPNSLKLYSKCSSNPTFRKTQTIRKTLNLTLKMANSSHTPKNSNQDLVGNGSINCSCCNRRQFVGSVIGTGLLPILPSAASGEDSNSTPQDEMALLNKIRPPRPDWYEELYAFAMDKLTKSYEAEVAVYKSKIFANLKGAEKILEVGIGTGPNLKYYANNPGVVVFGADPNRKMEKYAQAAAENAGLMPSNFKFVHAVAEALPLDDASVDAVIGTLVLCSVNDVDGALQEVRRVLKPGGFYLFVEHVAAKDGTIRRFVQGFLDPIQQVVADGCHLTRNTADDIARAGFTSVDINEVFLSTASIINPHVYGLAYK